MDAAGTMRRHLVQCARQRLVQDRHICGVLWRRREDGICVGSAVPGKRLDLLLVQLLRVICGRVLLLRVLLLRVLLLRLLRVMAIVAAARL